MSECTVVYLVRHARPLFPNDVPICMGRSVDLPLGDEGLTQARALKRSFGAIPIERVYSSPLKRALETACIIAGDAISLAIANELIELDGGEWDGLPLREIHERYPEHFNGERSVPPRGETDGSCLERVVPFLNTLEVSAGKCAVLVSHSGLNRILLSRVIGAPMRQKRSIPQDYAHVNRLVRENGIWRADRINLSAAELSGAVSA